MKFYVDLVPCSEKLDRRSLRYRFDLDQDIRWAELDAPGLYATNTLLDVHGIDGGVLRAHPEAHELFQWAFALAVCRSYDDLEENILRLVARIPQEFQASQSMGWMCEEEHKHVALFRRYGAHLRTQRPDMLARFDAIDARCRHVRSVGAPVALPASDASFLAAFPNLPFPEASIEHYGFWLGVIFFEELTIHLHQQLVDGGAEVQPAWLSAHAAHRREEIQHVATDVQILRALALDADSRQQAAIMSAYQLTRCFPYMSGIAAACELVRECYPALPRFEPVPMQLDEHFRQEIRTSPAFTKTRALFGGALLDS